MSGQSEQAFALLTLLARDRDAGTLNYRHLQIVLLVGKASDKRPVAATDIAQTMALLPFQVTRAADRLVELDLIGRLRDVPGQDRRLTFYISTPKGRALLARVAHASAIAA